LNQEAPLAIYALMTEMNFPYLGCSDLEAIRKVNMACSKVTMLYSIPYLFWLCHYLRRSCSRYTFFWIGY